MNIEQLIDTLLNGNANDRRRAAETLVKEGTQGNRYPIQGALENATEDKRSNAIGSLIQLGASAVPLLVEMLQYGNYTLCNLASDALGRIGAPALEPLIYLLEHNDGNSPTIIKTLGNLGDPRAIQPLIRILERKRYSRNADETSDWLEWLGCIQVIETLGKLGDSQKSNTQPPISNNPAKLGKEHQSESFYDWEYNPSAEKRSSTDICIKMLDAPYTEVRFAAIRTVLKFKDPQAIPVLVRGLKDSQLCGEILNGLDRMRFDARSVNYLLSGVEERNDTSERYVLDKLKQIGSDATNLLANALNGSNQPQQFMAARALASLKDLRAIKFLLDVAQRSKNSDLDWVIGEALLDIGSPAIELLLGRLVPGDDSASLIARRTLEATGTAAIPQLIKAMDNSQTKPYARYESAQLITSICQSNNRILKDNCCSFA